MKQLVLLLLIVLPAALAAQSTIATDNFNRANETPLATGGDWQRILTNNSSGNGTVNLTSNQIVAAGAEAVYHWQGTGTFDNARQFARATVIQPSGQVGLVLLGATGQALIAIWSGGTVAVYWYSAGLYQGNLAVASSPLQSGDNIEAVLDGGTVYAKVNGSIITSVANTTTLSSGRPGFETYLTGAILDNWEAGTPASYSISGTVTEGGIGLSGVLVTTRGAFSGSAITNGSGAYEITGVPSGTAAVIVTPTLTGYTMTPLIRTTGPVTTNVSAQDFAAVVNIASDDFNRANETPLTIGGNWQRIITNNSSGNGTVNLSGNRIVAAGAEAVYHWQGAGTFDNGRQFARATVVQPSGQAGIVLLGATGQALIATWSGGTMAVYWYSGGLYQGNLITTPSTLQAGDIIEEALNNDTVYVKVNGSIIASLFNTTTLSSGRPGFETYLTGAILDNWEAGTTPSFTHTIQASAGSGGNISPSGAVSIVHGGSQVFTITRNSGYHIADVLVDSVSVGPVGSYSFNLVTSDHTIAAMFAINQYSIAVTATNGTIAKIPDQALYDSNSVVQLTAVPNTGYHFVNWSGDVTGSTNPVSVTMNANKSITANFAINQYSIAITATNGAVAKIPDQALYDSNSVVQLTAVPNTGYHFVNWSGDVTGSTNPVSVTMNANKSITANFAINQYSIAITATNGTVTKNPDQATYDSNAVVQLTAVPNTGYHFVNWSGDATGSTNPVTVTMNANKNIIANFAINQYAIELTSTNGTVTKNPDQASYDSNSVVQLTAVPNTGYHFVNWSGDATGSTNPVSVTMNANKNITANLAINQYSIALTSVNGTVTKNPDQAAYDSNSVVQLTAAPNTGYHFVNWSGDVAGSTNPVSVTMNANKNITANFAINQYSIAITATNGTVAKNPDQALYDSNSVVQLTAVPNTGYHFVNWSGDVTGSTDPVSITMNSNKSITAHFAINQYSITLTFTNGTVTKNPDQASYDSNSVVQLTAVANTGYHFVNWSGDVTGSTNPVSVTMNSNKSITANFAINQYSIAITATNGTVAKIPDQALYDSNSVVQLTAVPNTGYHFVNWSGDVTGSTNPVTVTMNANKNITANFAINQYAIELTVTNGTVTKNPDQASYDSNSVVQLTAVANTGYHFVNWSGDATGSTNPVSVTMNANKSIKAHFVINQYSIALTSTNGTVTKNPDQASYDSNSVVQLTAVPNTGYHFVNWSGDVTGLTNPVSVTMNGNKSITANLAINQYSIALTSVNGTVAKNPDQASYDSNSVVQLTAAPNTGYHFMNWSGDVTGSTNPVSVTMNANKSITANFVINQYAINAIAGPNGSIMPSGTITVNHGSDTSFTISANSGYQVDSVFVDSALVGPVTSYAFMNVTTGHTIRAIFRTALVTINVPLQSDWNMISNPVTTGSDSVRQLYGNAFFAHAFSFSPGGGYVQRFTMLNGAGYWEKFPSADTQAVTGLPRTQDSISVAVGWNMVGTISSTVDTGTIVTLPPGLLSSIWFGFGATGYSGAAELHPGHAYWVKSNVEGKIILDASLLAKPATVQPSGMIVEEMLNAMTITDSRDRSQTLYFGADAGNGISLAPYDMPPTPPIGAFDARFETADGGSMVRTHPQKTSDALEFPLSIQSDAYPLTVTWHVGNGAASYELIGEIDGRAFESKQMSGDGMLKIASGEISRLTLRVFGDGQLPKTYSLLQNYPNPFNPVTTIKYDLPNDDRVSLKVYNVVGQEVTTLVNEEQKAGHKSINWNASNASSGVYFYRLNAGSFTSVKKLLLLK